MVQVHLFRPFSVNDLLDAVPAHGQGRLPCSIARKEPGARRRAALPGCRHGVRRGRGQQPPPLDAAHPRRPVRPLVEGIHAGDGEGGLRQPRRRSPRRTTSRSASHDDVSHTSLRVRPGVHHRGQGRRRLHLLRPGRRRHRRGQQELDQDHRRGDVRATRRGSSSTTRRSRDPGRPRTCASGPGRSGPPTSCSARASSHATSSQFIERVEHAARGRRRRGVPAEQPVRPRRGLGPAAAHDAERHHPQADPLLRDRCRHGRDRRGHGRAHQHDHADLLLRDLGRAAARRSHPQDQGRHRGHLRQEGPRARREELRGGGPHARAPARGEAPDGRRRARGRPRPPCRSHAPAVRAER